MADDKPKTSADLYELQMQNAALVKEIADHVGGKKWCLEQAVKIVAADNGVKPDPVELAQKMYDFLVKP